MKCKLLVAEDELIERKVLCRTLQKYLGDLISLYEAKNGREALEIFAREAPQVAVLDIEMPGLTGLEVARSIRETDKNCAILFLTGFDKFDYARQAISVRAMDYLLKPLSRSGVEAVLQRVRARLDAETLRRRDVEELRACAKRDQLQLQRMALIESITDDSPNLPADGPGSLAEFLPGRLGVVELLSGQEQEAALAKDFGGNPGLMEFSVRQIAQELTETGDIPGLCAPHRKRLAAPARCGQRRFRL